MKKLYRQETTHWKRPWCWEGLRTGGEEDERGRDGWIASLTECTWVWASSGRCWKTGKPAVLQSIGSQKVGHDRAIVQQLHWYLCKIKHSKMQNCSLGNCWLIPSQPEPPNLNSVKVGENHIAGSFIRKEKALFKMLNLISEGEVWTFYLFIHE